MEFLSVRFPYVHWGTTLEGRRIVVLNIHLQVFGMFNMLGGWHRVALLLETIAKLGHQLARVVGRNEGETVQHFRHRLGVVLVRDNMQITGGL